MLSFLKKPSQRSSRRSSLTFGRKLVVSEHPLTLDHAGHGSFAVTVQGSEFDDAFDPNTFSIKLWQQILLMGLIYEAFLIPFLLSFKAYDKNQREMSTLFICELLFLADFYIQAHTGYYEDGNMVRDRTLTRRKYFLSSNFLVDLLAIVPMSLFPIPLREGLPRAVLEMHKLTRIWRLRMYVNTLDDVYARFFVLLKIVKLLMSTIMLSHFVACIRFSFGYDIHHDNEWLPEHPEQERTVRTSYLQALFWSFGVLSGLFEGELPHSVGQFLFTIFVALCGFSLFTSLCATLFTISKCESGNSETSEARINQLKHLLSFHRVPEALQAQAVEYLRKDHTETVSKDREALKLICPSIAKDIQVELLRTTVSTVPLFGGCSDQFVVALTSLLETISIPAHYVLFREGDYGNAMYIMHSGVLHVMIKSVKVREMRKGTCLGEISVFSDCPRTATVVAATYAVLYRLCRFHADCLMEGYPTCGYTIREFISAMTTKSRTSSSSALALPPLQRSTSQNSSTSSTSKKSLLPPIFKKSLFELPGKIKNQKVIPTISHREEEAHEVARELCQPTTNGTASTRETAVRSFRKGSTSPLRDRESVVRSYYDKMSRTATPNQHAIWSKVLLSRCLDADSKQRMWWILVLQLDLLYNWILIPLQLGFQLLDRSSWYLDLLNTIADLVLFVDMYINFNLSYVHNAEKIMNTASSASQYLRTTFLADLLCALPYWLVVMANPYVAPRLPRLLRAWRMKGHFEEIDRFFHLNSRQRLTLFAVLLVTLYHVTACLYFAITYTEGFGHSEHEDTWLPSMDIALVQLNATHYQSANHKIVTASEVDVVTISARQYFRSLYYAANVLTALGKTIEPASDVQYVAALCFMLSGFIITGIVVDNVQKRFTASAFEQKEFFGTRSRIQLFLRRQDAPLAIHQRVNAFLDFWWSSHRGAVIGELLADLPESIKHDILRSICSPALQTISLLQGVRPVLEQLEDFFVDNIKFILFGQGEVVYRLGDYPTGIYFVLEGEVSLVDKSNAPRSVSMGGFFGSAALSYSSNMHGFEEHVSATSGCILVFLSREHLLAMESIYLNFPSELLALEKRLLAAKLTRRDGNRALDVRHRPVLERRPSSLRRLILAKTESVFDPDSSYLLVWETWVFFAMTIQWMTVIFQVCFRMKRERHIQTDALAAFFEVTFCIDLFLRFRVGFYEYGNKIMDPHLIRRNYLWSKLFWIDVIALLPFFFINWVNPPESRVDALNLNKLLRVWKVPRQLQALETRYLKVTTELRLFKLVYYTFLLSHALGCMWFDFASHASRITLLGTVSEGTAFGVDEWAPPASLEKHELNLQYFASLFWSFGLMSASTQGELPKTVGECLFSVITMTSGFFLFAYVIGNFSDIIELMDAGNRDFNAKMSSLRRFLSHFTLPQSIEDRLKTYLLFKRFHTITQEHILERCLPPSLLTDIRLVHLQPMIAKVAFLAGMEGPVTRMLVSSFSQLIVVRDELVCRFGEQGSDMFFVFTGVLDVLLPVELVADEYCAFDESSPNTEVAPNAGPDPMQQPLLSYRPSSAEDSSVEIGAIDAKAMKKINEVTAGSYFGENALFTKALRNAFVRARTSCVLYRLSRESVELVFDRYPQWKQKVLRIVNIQQDQQRLARMSDEEQKRNASNAALLRIDYLNEKAEQVKHDMNIVRFRRSSTDRGSQEQHTRLRMWRQTLFRWFQRYVPLTLSGLVNGAQAQSKLHIFWIRVIVVCTVNVAIIVPYRIAFDPLDRSTPVALFVKANQVVSELLFIVDIWFNWHIRAGQDSMELYEQDHLEAYKRESLVWDALAAFPVDLVIVEFHGSVWLRLLRCLKVLNLMRYLNEINRRSVSYEANRLRAIWVIYMLMIYWCACAYLLISTTHGYAEEWSSWEPCVEVQLDDPNNATSEQLTLRLLRGLFFGTTAFVKKGRTFVPTSTLHYVFTISCCFFGLLVMAFMIGEIASLFISYIGNEIEFQKNHIALEHYLSRSKVSPELKDRVHAFLSTLWSSHGGLNYESLFEDIPMTIRTACVLHISQRPFRAFVSSTFAPVAWQAKSELEEFTRALAQGLRFESYPRDENVLIEGDINKAMYFVVKGHLYQVSHTIPALNKPTPLRRGGFFGEHGLLGSSVSAITVRTLRACDLLSLSSESLQRVVNAHVFSRTALSVAHRAVAQMSQITLPPNASHEDMLRLWGTSLQAVLSEKQKTNRSPKAQNLAVSALYAGVGASPMRVREILQMLETPSECFQAFRALLQLLLPIDVLDADAHLSRRDLGSIAKLALSTEKSMRFMDSSHSLTSNSSSAARRQSDVVESIRAADQSLRTTAPTSSSLGRAGSRRMGDSPVDIRTMMVPAVTPPNVTANTTPMILNSGSPTRRGSKTSAELSDSAQALAQASPSQNVTAIPPHAVEDALSNTVSLGPDISVVRQVASDLVQATDDVNEAGASAGEASSPMEVAGASSGSMRASKLKKRKHGSSRHSSANHSQQFSVTSDADMNEAESKLNGDAAAPGSN